MQLEGFFYKLSHRYKLWFSNDNAPSCIRSVFFQDSCIFAQLTFFTLSSYFIKVIGSIHGLFLFFFFFLEQLYLQSGYFFRAASFLEQSPFLSILFQISCFFSAKPPPRSCFMRINSSLGQLRFPEQPLYRRTSYFFMASTSTQHQILQNSYFFNKATFTIQVPFSTVSFSEKLLSGTS